MRTFAIIDGSRRRALPCGWLSYDEQTREFGIELSDRALEHAPLMLELLAQKGERFVGHDLSLRWVQERIPPPGRQNIGQVLKANGLDEYDEFALLMSSMGACSQDDFLLREVSPEGARESAGRYSGRDFEAQALAREVGATLAQCRREVGMTQRALSERTGVQQAVISRIERGRGNPTLDLVQALAVGMGVSLRIVPMANAAQTVGGVDFEEPARHAARDEAHEAVLRRFPYDSGNEYT